MSKRLYIGNIPFTTEINDLRDHIANEIGPVDNIEIIFDKNSGKSKGFAFVEMEEKNCAVQAIEQLDGTEFQGRKMKVSKAKPIVPKPQKANFGRMKF